MKWASRVRSLSVPCLQAVSTVPFPLKLFSTQFYCTTTTGVLHSWVFQPFSVGLKGSSSTSSHSLSVSWACACRKTTWPKRDLVVGSPPHWYTARLDAVGESPRACRQVQRSSVVLCGVFWRKVPCNQLVSLFNLLR